MITTVISSIIAFTLGASLMYYNYYQKTQTSDSSPCNLDYLDNEKNKLISSFQAKEMYNSYTENRVIPITEFEKTRRKRKEFSPTRYASYSWKDFNDYIDYIKCLNDLLKQNPKYREGIQSLRIYFAKYPNSDKFRSVNKPIGEGAHREGEMPSDYKGRNTIFILPTIIQDEKEHAFEFNINYKNKNNPISVSNLVNFDESNPAPLIPSATFQPNLSSTDLGFDPNGHSTILNEAGLTPPPH